MLKDNPKVHPIQNILPDTNRYYSQVEHLKKNNNCSEQTVSRLTNGLSQEISI